MPRDVIEAIRRARAELLARDAYRMRQLMSAYSQIWMRLQSELDELYAAAARGEEAWALTRAEALTRQVEAELRRYARLADNALEDGVEDGIDLAQEAGEDLVRASLGRDGPELVSKIGWHRLPSNAVETMLGLTGRGSPLHQRMEQRLGPAVAQEVSEHLAEGIARGWGPRYINALLRKDLGQGLDWSLTQTRTATLYAYREAERLSWQENPDLVEAWIWRSARAIRTCFPAGTCITTRRGPIPIEQVQVGDYVLTHRGRWRRVTETTCRRHAAPLVVIHAGGMVVRSTADHPFLVERQGQLHWIEAGRVRLGDCLVCQVERRTRIGNHALSHRAIKRRIRQAHNPMAMRLKPKRFAGIALADGFAPVPVDAIHFDNGIQRRDVEINRIPPARESVLLEEINLQEGEAGPKVGFRFRLAGEAAVAADRTELLVGHARLNAELLAAGEAGVESRRAAARFRAIIPGRARMRIEQLATTPAGDMSRGLPASSRAVGKSLGAAGFYMEGLPTAGAGYGDMSRRLPAGQRAIIAHVPMVLGAEGLAAMFTGVFRTWARRRAGAAMRALALGGTIAGLRAVFPAAKSYPSGGNGEGLAATFADSLIALRGVAPCSLEAILGAVFPAAAPYRAGGRRKWLTTTFANNFHVQSTVRLQHHVQFVYNLEVEDDHSYVAGGFAVHNCPACLMMDGRRFPLSTPLRDHWNGRCTAEPVPPAELRPPRWKPGQTGRQWFEKQDPEFQRSMLGPMTYDAWKEGLIRLQDLAMTARTPVYGRMLRVRSLADALAKNKAPEGTMQRLRSQRRPAGVTRAAGGPTGTTGTAAAPAAPVPDLVEEIRLRALEIDTQIQNAVLPLKARRRWLEKQAGNLPRKSQERADLRQEAQKIDLQSKQVREQHLETFRQSLYRDPPCTPSLQPMFSLLPRNVQQGYETFCKWVGREEINGEIIDIRPHPGTRSGYDPATRTAAVSLWDGPDATIHELAHFLELTVPDVQQEMEAFYNRRTAGVAPVSLQSLYPKRGYHPQEVVRPGCFMTNYMGKDYHAMGLWGTELLSEGLEWMYRDPGRLAAADPEMFRLILNVIRRGHTWRP